jgi:phospholipid/cholesterol/gamma-HCH transport system ATP-binding protein
MARWEGNCSKCIDRGLVVQKPPLSFERLHVAFGTQPILRDLSFEIVKGQTLVVLGESGCGKTVLMKAMVGLQTPTSGVVRFDGESLSSMSQSALNVVRRRMGYLFQSAALFDSLSAFDNVAYPMRTHLQLLPSEIRERTLARLKEVGLPQSSADKMPSELSGGMRKRVGLARALALDPEFVFYDEPTTGLDPVTTDTINELIVQTRERRPVTSIIVTHEMKTVERCADRVIMLHPLSQLRADESQILFDGSVDELKASSDPRIRRFLGR